MPNLSLRVSTRPAWRSPGMMYAVLVVMWGLVWPAAKIALQDCPPLLFAGLRILLSGLALLPWTVRHLHRSQVLVNMVLSIFNVALFFGLQTVALQRLAPGLVSILVYVQPVVTALLARWWLHEQLSILKVVGVIVGFAGVGVISSTQLHAARVGLWGMVLGLLAGVAWAVGTVAYKRYQAGSNPVQDMGIQLTTGGVLLVLAGTLHESWGAIHWSGGFVAALLFTALLGTSLAWVLWSALLQTGEASRVATWTFSVPVLATLLSVLWLGERLSSRLWYGGLLVMSAIYLVNTRRFSRSALRTKRSAEQSSDAPF